MSLSNGRVDRKAGGMSDPILSARACARPTRAATVAWRCCARRSFRRAGRERERARRIRSGKSTLLHLLAGLDTPDAGEVRWGGIDRHRCARARHSSGSYSIVLLYSPSRCAANCSWLRRILGRLDAAAHKRADELLARVGLAERGITCRRACRRRTPARGGGPAR